MSKNHYEENPVTNENLENPTEDLEGSLEESLGDTLEESVEESTDEIIEEPIEEYMEAEDLSCAEDEDRIFILDENGKSVEVEVEDDAADD